jgi:hypothetical protein
VQGSWSLSKVVQLCTEQQHALNYSPCNVQSALENPNLDPKSQRSQVQFTRCAHFQFMHSPTIPVSQSEVSVTEVAAMGTAYLVLSSAECKVHGSTPRMKNTD